MTWGTMHSSCGGGHLADLRRELPDWLRAQTGWPEAAVAGACRLTAAVTGAASLRVEADVGLDHDVVRLHVEDCRCDADLTADVEGASIHVVAHDGDVLVHLA